MSADFPFDDEDLTGWLEWSSEDFIIAILSHLRTQLAVIRTNTLLIHKDERISSIPQSELEMAQRFKKLAEENPHSNIEALYQAGSQGNVGDLTSGVLESVDRILKIVSTAHRYADAKKRTDSHRSE